MSTKSIFNTFINSSDYWENKDRYLFLQFGTVFAVVLIFIVFIIFSYEGNAQYYRLYYFVPVSVPVTLFLFDRIKRQKELTGVLLFIDIMIAGISLIRVYYPIPFYSGHALFLSFSLSTAKNKVCLASTVLILLQTVYIKIFLWDDGQTLYGGILLGLLAGVTHHYLRRKTLPAKID